MSSNPKLIEYRKLWTEPISPKISFPIATYNRPDILKERTLPSILNQSYSNVEVVIIGDRCRDDRYEELRYIDSRVRYFNLQRRSEYPEDGFSLWCAAGCRPRNISARLCSGEYHWWISDDDTLEELAVDNFISYVSCNPEIESVYANNGFVDHQGNLVINTLQSAPAPLEFPITGMPSWINRSYLSRLFKWNPSSFKNTINRPSDYDLQSRMWQAGVRFGYLNEHLSTSWASQEYGGKHGSNLYRHHAKAFR